MPGLPSNPVILLQPFTTSPSSSDVPSFGAGLDKVTLNGQDLYVRSVVRGEVISEFEAGFKIGPARYDNREHAFYQVMDDFSKGFGKRRADMEDPGHYWVASPRNAPDVTRPGHMTLGPLSDALQPTPPTAYEMVAAHPSSSALDEPDGYYVSIGSAVYFTADGVTFNRVYDTVFSEVSSLIRLSWSGALDDGLLTDRIERWAANRVGSLWRNGHNADDDYDFAGTILGGTDIMYYDGKLLICLYNMIYYAVVVHGDVDYNIHPTTIEGGTDQTPIATLPEVPNAIPTWMGIAEAPWGTMSPYIRAGQNVYVVDFYARKAFKIDIGLNNARILASCQWGGNFYISDGWNVIEYNPATRTSVNVGFPRQDGIPEELTPANGDYYINAFIPAEDRLYAILVNDGLSDNTRTFLVFQMKVGHPGEWNQCAEGQHVDITSHHGFQLNFANSRYLYIAGRDAPTGGDVNTTRLVRYFLPGRSRVPLYGRDRFAPSGAFLITSWYDGGFSEIDGVALRMTIDAWHLTASETIKVEYQLDNDEDSTWYQMVDMDNQPAVFNNINKELFFNNTADPILGTKFRTIRYRITWNRGGNDTLSVEVRALTFVYKKEPPPRTSWTFIVDVNRMVQEKIDVGGADATTASVWSFLRQTKAATTLVPFSVPSVQTGLRVDVDKLIIEADDIRQPEDGRSKITVTVLEPVAPQNA